MRVGQMLDKGQIKAIKFKWFLPVTELFNDAFENTIVDDFGMAFVLL
jgi:hypothetical protein